MSLIVKLFSLDDLGLGSYEGPHMFHAFHLNWPEPLVTVVAHAQKFCVDFQTATPPSRIFTYLHLLFLIINQYGPHRFNSHHTLMTFLLD